MWYTAGLTSGATVSSHDPRFDRKPPQFVMTLKTYKCLQSLRNCPRTAIHTADESRKIRSRHWAFSVDDRTRGTEAMGDRRASCRGKFVGSALHIWVLSTVERSGNGVGRVVRTLCFPNPDVQGDSFTI